MKDEGGRNEEGRARRASGILLHITSLPSPYGIGDLGPEAYRFVDDLARARQTWWQLLPLGPPAAGNSPYQCYSAFAGNPDLISPELLVKDGLLRRDDPPRAKFDPRRVDYRAAGLLKMRLLMHAWERFRSAKPRRISAAFEKFLHEHSTWLDDHALFNTLRLAHRNRPWNQWPRDLAFRDPSAIREARHQLADSIERERFIQFLFYDQLSALRKYALSKGVRLMGDLPIFISADSADVWLHPELFLLDRRGRPTAVAGAPPDFFSKTGQRWGNVLYDWDEMKKRRYAWWADRVRITLQQVDLVRLDHFRGFIACWRIPAHLPTAVGGRWCKGPGRDLFLALRRQIGPLPFVAEDLGLITPDVKRLRDELGFPGMRVIQFAFGEPDSEHLPHNHPRNCIAYTGTHDNDTTLGWYRSLKQTDRRRIEAYAPGADADPAGAMLRLTWSSVADIAIAPLQDVLGLGSEARMNFPGKPRGNWEWRFERKLLTPRILDRLGQLTETFGRAKS